MATQCRTSNRTTPPYRKFQNVIPISHRLRGSNNLVKRGCFLAFQIATYDKPRFNSPSVWRDSKYDSSQSRNQIRQIDVATSSVFEFKQAGTRRLALDQYSLTHSCLASVRLITRPMMSAKLVISELSSGAAVAVNLQFPLFLDSCRSSI